MASQDQTQGPAPPTLQDYPPLGAGSPPEHGFGVGNARQPGANMNGGRNTHRISGDWRAHGPNPGNGVPAGPHVNAPNAGHRQFGGGGGFEGARSPPNSKNTSHVPCKFFKVGQCQAGKACPFSHSTDASKFEQPCKYFSKGNCKFGQKCALLHILPNGRVVNKPNMNVGNLNIGGRVDPAHFQNQESTVGSSLLSQQVGGMPQPFSHQIPQIPDLDHGMPTAPRSQPFDIPKSSAQFNTPLQEAYQAMSPIPHLTTLDAPLPASFDSNGISYIARHGPVAASMPPKVGLDSPPSSLPKKAGVPTEAYRNLQESGHGNSNRGFNLGSSPSGPAEDNVGPRVMHSQRVSRPKMVSASLPRRFDQEWEHAGDEMFGAEEYIPADLSHLMTPEERNRRSSGKVENPVAIREGLTGNNTPANMSTRFGSPSHASPSRFSPWNKPKTNEDHSGAPSPNYGPVGSPLRNATLHPNASPNLRAVREAADLAFKISSPPRQSSTSIISQQLQRTRLSSRAAESGEASPSGLHPTRHTSNPRSAFDRAVSATSVTNERIDEEQPELVFSLEEDYNASNYRPSSHTIWGTAGISRTASSANKGSWATKDTSKEPQEKKK